MGKAIVICCDGTANQFARDKTNVLRTFEVVHKGQGQVAVYLPGIGTMEPPGPLTDIGRRAVRIAAMAFGYGLEHEIRKAYGAISRLYEPGDRLYLFGFSRGAYTVRAVAALIHMYGLLPAAAEDLHAYAIRYLIDAGRSRDPAHFGRAKAFKKTFSVADCRVHFLGAWDTVSSVGWFGNPLTLRYTARNPSIDNIRHALAIDERRAFFRTNQCYPTDEAPAQDLRQVWFAGVHSDIGGGYPAAEAGLAKISFRWMMAEAEAKGLAIDAQALDLALNDQGPPDPQGKLHRSLTPAWWPAEFVPKARGAGGRDGLRLNLFRRRTIPEGAHIHGSVFARQGYAPILPAQYETV
ncbi:DUF2235 domain-containing protein [Zavarzinia compransoris]|uniref:T6SS Phospholipase effector Tle1-like catalytic domain-containing protein n=1 Tax=Zavarzinia compransoris TaxID=1264899 RepID=A0A317DYL3_9PROT|nr:DUF2235 domain-containing protein [Zavarzinia compransoris]PWR19769.1 hypothetical protein DKG75_15015 [Zavarzinia compransoris]TDP45128.1 uncharacterized protein (DUF2235 family) [Zavarzinia compransoris]